MPWGFEAGLESPTTASMADLSALELVRLQAARAEPTASRHTASLWHGATNILACRARLSKVAQRNPEALQLPVPAPRVLQSELSQSRCEPHWSR